MVTLPASTVEVRGCQRDPGGERIACRQGNTDALPRDFDGGHPRFLYLAAHQGDVHVCPVERSDGGHPGGERPRHDLDVGELPAPLGEQVGKEIGR